MGGLFQPSQERKFYLPSVDLPEHGFHDRFVPAVNGAALLRLQLPGHTFPQGRSGGDSAPRNVGNPLTVFHPAGRDEKLSPPTAGGLNIFA